MVTCDLIDTIHNHRSYSEFKIPEERRHGRQQLRTLVRGELERRLLAVVLRVPGGSEVEQTRKSQLAAFVDALMLLSAGSLELTFAPVGFGQSGRHLLTLHLLVLDRLLERVQPHEVDLAEGLPGVEVVIGEILLAVELHVFLAGEVLATIAAVPEGVVEVVAEDAHPVALPLVLLIGGSAVGSDGFEGLVGTRQSVHGSL